MPHWWKGRKDDAELLVEFLHHRDYCQRWCRGRSDHGGHEIESEKCNCGLEELMKRTTVKVKEIA